MELGDVGRKTRIVELPPIEPRIEPAECAGVGAAGGVGADRGVDQAARGRTRRADRAERLTHDRGRDRAYSGRREPTTPAASGAAVNRNPPICADNGITRSPGSEAPLPASLGLRLGAAVGAGLGWILQHQVGSQRSRKASASGESDSGRSVNRVAPAGRIGDTLHDGKDTVVAIVNAFTTVSPETDATVRVVDYRIVGAASDQFRVYSNDENDIGCWRRLGVPDSPVKPDETFRPRPGDDMLTAETCGVSRSAVEFVIEARIVAHGQRLRGYKKLSFISSPLRMQGLRGRWRGWSAWRTGEKRSEMCEYAFPPRVPC